MDNLNKTREELMDDLIKIQQERESLHTKFQAETIKRLQAEERLRFNEEKYELIAHSTLETIFILDQRGHCIFFNDSLESLLGYKNEDVVGLPFTKFVPIKEIPRFLIQLKNVFMDKIVHDFVTQVYHKDGHLVDVEINGKLTRYKGELAGQGTIRDVSARMQVQNALEDSLQSYKGLFDSVSEAIYIHKEDGVFINVNTGAVKMYGYSRNELIGRSPELVSAPGLNDLQEVSRLIHKTMTTGKPEQMEFWGLRKNGEIFPKDVIFHKGLYKGEEVIITTARDITEHKLAEQNLRLYKEIIDHSADGIAILDLNGFYIEQNDSHKVLIGFTDKELEGKTPAIHLGDDTFSIIQQELATHGRFKGEVVSHTRNGDAVIELNAFTLKNDQGEILCQIVIQRDITKRKKAEQALRESEAKYRILAEKMHDVVWILNLDLQVVYVSPSTEYILGFTPEERMSMRIDECMVPESLDYAMQVLINEAVTSQEASADKGRGVLLELEYYHKDGSTRWLEQSINGIYDENGELTEIMGVARDITERKKANDALQQNAESYRALFNSVTDAIYVLDQDGKFIDVNLGAIDMYGYPHEVLVGKDPAFVSAPGMNDFEKITEMLKSAFKGNPQQFEFWGKKSNNEHFLKDVRLRNGTYFGQKVIVAIARDITTRKQAEIALTNKVNELECLNKRLTGEEQQLASLKHEVNELLAKMGEEKKYYDV
ncbi:MAG: PAS domain S-box protein [Bacteroidetes bacterium]|nr:PAS domain S-box protein [Bacteroidota bacterium]